MKTEWPALLAGLIWGLSSTAGCVAKTQAQSLPGTTGAAAASAAPAAVRVTGWTAPPHALVLTTSEGIVSIRAVSDHVLRVRASRDVTGKDFSWAVVAGANRPKGTLTVKDTGSALLAATPDVHVRIEKNPLRIAFLDKADRVISEDAPGRPLSLGPRGFRVEHTMPDDEHYYGLGDKAGPLDRRDMAFTNWNTDAYAWQESTDPLYKSIPFFLAMRHGRAHGIFLDNTWRSWFDFGKAARDAYAFGADGGELDYYFIDGPAPKAVLERYADLTGKTPLPPLWSLGYQQCRYSYFPEARVYEVAKTFRDKKIPADVIYLDIDYQKDNRPFTIDRQRFPHFEQMIKDLGRQGFKVIAITDLHLAKPAEPGYKPYDEGAAANNFVHNADGSVYVGKVWPGASVFPDFTWAPARAWWGTLYADFVGMGVAGFWNDMNEPSIFDVPSKTMPLDVVHRVDAGGTATHREIHNVFGMQNSRATYDGLLKLQPDRRPVVLTRATYAGGQRFAASWTGDNTSTWNHYRLSVPTLLNLGLSGYPLVGDDIGGFRKSPPADLLTRWFELGAFNPIFRDHSEKGTLDQEPWVHGRTHEAIRRRFIESRYRLLPYIYTLAEEAARTGLPLMRPVWLEAPEAEAFYTNDRVFMFGADLLVEPKLDETVDPEELSAPAGVWYDYWTGQRWTGAKKKTPAALDELPVLVRGGAIIPHQPLVQSTSETPKGPLELRVYPGADCRGSLYLDDGASFKYQKGEFLRLAFSCQQEGEAGKSISVKTGAAEGSYTPWFQSLTIVVHGAPSAPRQVIASGEPSRNFRYDKAKKTVTVTVPYAKGGQVVTVGY
jgi:alpha-glucosidase